MDILCIGAHPDDCEFGCGGTAALAAARGDRVTFVSVTNGDRGHHAEQYRTDRSSLASRRLEEARRSVAVFGGEFRTLGVPDGDVYVTQQLTEEMVRLIRSVGRPGHGPDLVLLNRPNDYHRDHRYTSQLVLDATYLLMVPLMCPDVQRLERMPVFAYWWDRFHEGGGAFRPDVVVPVDSVIEDKAQMLAAHESQLLEWLPYVGGWEKVPEDPVGRMQYIRNHSHRRSRQVADQCRTLGAGVPANCTFAEAFQISEYGRQPAKDELAKLFPLA
jgi:N-acetylglucosamine malate deacetylase 1